MYIDVKRCHDLFDPQPCSGSFASFEGSFSDLPPCLLFDHIRLVGLYVGLFIYPIYLGALVYGVSVWVRSYVLLFRGFDVHSLFLEP